MEKKPNFFILGAPKCGTTALAHWLGNHPNVFMAKPKEPHFYNSDARNQVAQRTRSEYFALFKDASKSQTSIGEASVWYLYSANAVQNILTENPEAKFIVSLRNPADLAYSLHRQLLLNGQENIRDLAEAWEAQPLRENGFKVPILCTDQSLLYYQKTCALGSQLERLYENCGKENVHTIFLDDLHERSSSVWNNLIKFLDLPPQHRTQFPKINGASERKSAFLSQSIRYISLARRIVGAPSFGMGIPAALDKWNRRDSSRQKTDAGMHEYLQKFFQAEVELIEEFTNRSLMHWKNTAQ